jgi:hypothetical protein
MLAPSSHNRSYQPFPEPAPSKRPLSWTALSLVFGGLRWSIVFVLSLGAGALIALLTNPPG